MALGGKRAGAGRPKGSPNKATASIREAAQQYTDQALGVLAEVMTSGDSAAARVAAANSLLDRAYGRPAQSVKVGGDEDNPNPITHRIERVLVDPQNPDS